MMHDCPAERFGGAFLTAESERQRNKSIANTVVLASGRHPAPQSPDADWSRPAPTQRPSRAPRAGFGFREHYCRQWAGRGGFEAGGLAPLSYPFAALPFSTCALLRSRLAL